MITLKLTLRPPSTILKDVFRHDEMKCFVCNANGGQFSFPKEEDKLQKWITSLDIDRPKIVGANGPRICLKHFDQNDFTQKNRTRLASSAELAEVEQGGAVAELGPEFVFSGGTRSPSTAWSRA